MRWSRWSLALALLCCVGCASTTTINRFSQFATAGQSYVQSVDALLNNTSGLLVQADSIQLMDERTAQGSGTAAELQAHDDKLEEPLQDIRLMRRQTDLLDLYFQQLAGSVADAKKAPAQAASDLDKISTSLKGLAQDFGKSDLLQYPQAVETLAKGTARLVVKGVAARELVKQLEKDKDVISQALLEQEAGLEALSAMAVTAQGFITKAEYRQTVVEPFAGSSPLPANWEQTRQTVLLKSTVPDGLEAAVTAAVRLQIAWTELLSSTLGDDDVQSMAADLESLQTTVRAGLGETETTNPAAGKTP